MIKAVFFDWFNTLAHYNPPREELQSQVLQEFGINISPQKIIPSLLIADRDYLEENATFPIRQRSLEERTKINRVCRHLHYIQWRKARKITEKTSTENRVSRRRAIPCLGFNTLRNLGRSSPLQHCSSIDLLSNLCQVLRGVLFA